MNRQGLLDSRVLEAFPVGLQTVFQDADKRFEVTTGSFCRFEPGQSNSPHAHSYFETCYLMGGGGTFRHGPDTYPIREGDVFTALPHCPHEIIGGPTGLVLVFIRYTLLPSVEPDDVHQRGVGNQAGIKPVVLEHADEKYLPYVRLLCRPASRPVMRRVLEAFMLDIIASSSASPASDDHCNSEVLEIYRVVETVRTNIMRLHTVQQVAAALHMTERTFNRWCHTHLEMAPSCWLRELRMMHAAQRLLMRARVSEVSDELGYSSPAQFSQSFRNHFGMPPKVYQLTHAPRANAPHTRAQ